MTIRSCFATALAAAALAGCAHPAAPTASSPVATAAPAPATPVHAAGSLAIKSLAERKVAALPGGTLYWRIENMASLEKARAAAGAHAIAVDAGGRTWLLTLGAQGGATPGATKVAEVGPIPRVQAAEYLLRINEATGAPGARTPVHSHPGSEAFYVLSGEQSIRGAHGVMKVRSGTGEAGHGADMAMEVSSSGAEPLHALVMFVVDASRPFSTPAKLP